MEYRLFLVVNGYLLQGNMESETETDTGRDRSIYYLRGRFRDSLKGLDRGIEKKAYIER